jgi:hypothetical protein
VRSVRLEDGTLDDPEIQELMKIALAQAKVPIDSTNRGQIVIKSISAKQRARRPSSKTSTAAEKRRMQLAEKSLLRQVDLPKADPPRG